MTTTRFLTFTADKLPVAYARLICLGSGTNEQAYMQVDRCPLCGGRHVHAAERLFDRTGRQVGYAPSYIRCEARCTETERRIWQEMHPEYKDLQDVGVYALVPVESGRH